MPRSVRSRRRGPRSSIASAHLLRRGEDGPAGEDLLGLRLIQTPGRDEAFQAGTSYPANLPVGEPVAEQAGDRTSEIHESDTHDGVSAGPCVISPVPFYLVGRR